MTDEPRRASRRRIARRTAARELDSLLEDEGDAGRSHEAALHAACLANAVLAESSNSLRAAYRRDRRA